MSTFNINKVTEGIPFRSGELDNYTFEAFSGKGEVALERGDSLWLLNGAKAKVKNSKGTYKYNGMAVIIRGYRTTDKTSKFDMLTNLPYVNGCSSFQIFPASRVGDPTMQLLYIPKGSHEQEHHIHSTTRVVYVASGSGYSMGGINGDEKRKLEKGDVLVFDRMTAHHFEAPDEALLVVPLHVFSSTGTAEFNHPMFNGTHQL